ncbi:MAG: class I SAM-dependent methyltransferase [Candidatus Eisenbacteria sp.]|nr:class I SAM-dependent methyltransferase [Candidatus Eisenbacteria bacterium]
MNEQHSRPAEHRLHALEEQEVALEDFACGGRILDIGGGGEGVIGELKGSSVVAVDRRRGELEAAPPGPLKIVMDVRELQFLDGTFHCVTAFFSLCYVPGGDHELILREAFRVLRPRGDFLVWDLIAPPRPDGDKDILVIPLAIRLPHRQITTSYGVSWPIEGRDVGYYVRLAEAVGFELISRQEWGRVFHLHLRRP